MMTRSSTHLNFELVTQDIIEIQASTSMDHRSLEYLIIGTGFVCYEQGEVWICMELMDTSLDKLYKV